ncbi:MAG TPA: hypothetical protein VJU16_04960, partial [Planctomycetota bacterium]|nr:hypothetical protein [Planctomycetota bacterium]
YWIQILIVGFILNASTLVASVSLLFRRSWARTILQILIAGQLAGLVLMTVIQVKFTVSFMDGFQSPMTDPGFVKPAFTVIFVAMTLGISAGFCTLHALSIAKLRSAKVRAVFEGPPPPKES